MRAAPYGGAGTTSDAIASEDSRRDARRSDADLRIALRDGTHDWHLRVEEAFAVFDLGRRDGLRGFLLAQARAVLPLERALDRFGAADVVPDWPRRRRGDALRHDLDAFAVSVPPECELPDLSSRERRIGALYVLEGSRLGGRVLARQVGTAGAEAAPTAFLLHSAGPGAWPSFLTVLGSPGLDRDELLAGARDAFAMFRRAAILQAAADGLCGQDGPATGEIPALPARGDHEKHP